MCVRYCLRWLQTLSMGFKSGDSAGICHQFVIIMEELFSDMTGMFWVIVSAAVSACSLKPYLTGGRLCRSERRGSSCGLLPTIEFRSTSNHFLWFDSFCFSFDSAEAKVHFIEYYVSA